jgi:hypothetical protein
MASALETRIRKLESRIERVAAQSMGHVNKPPFDWEAFNRLFEEMYAEHPGWLESGNWENLKTYLESFRRRTQCSRD